MVSPKVPFALTEANKTISTVASLSFKIKPKSHRTMKQQQSSCLNYKTKIQKRELKNITAKNCRLLDITNSTRQKGNLDLLNEKL